MVAWYPTIMMGLDLRLGLAWPSRKAGLYAGVEGCHRDPLLATGYGISGADVMVARDAKGGGVRLVRDAGWCLFASLAHPQALAPIGAVQLSVIFHAKVRGVRAAEQ